MSREYQYLELVDPETGEFFEVQRRYCSVREDVERKEKDPLPAYDLSKIECKEFFYAKLKGYYDEVKYTKLKIDKSVLDILLDKDLSVGALSLLAYLARNIYYRNYVYFVMDDFLEDMEVSERTANRYLKELFGKYIKEIPSQAPMREMILAMNPNLFYFGKESMRVDSTQKWVEIAI